MMEHPTLKCNFQGGSFSKLKKLRYPIGYKLWLLAPTSKRATFALNNTQGTIGKMSIMSLLILSTMSFWVDKMMWFLKFSLVREFIFWISLHTTWMSDNKFGSCSMVMEEQFCHFHWLECGHFQLWTINLQILKFLKMLKPNGCFVVTSIYVHHNNYLQQWMLS